MHLKQVSGLHLEILTTGLSIRSKLNSLIINDISESILPLYLSEKQDSTKVGIPQKNSLSKLSNAINLIPKLEAKLLLKPYNFMITNNGCFSRTVRTSYEPKNAFSGALSVV